jgi:uncharacterized membrane protein YjfL (UPF0719 family)
MNSLVNALIAALAFSVLGILMLSLAFWIITKITPFSIRKEIEDDQNIALAILIGSVMLGISIIVAAAVHS